MKPFIPKTLPETYFYEISGIARLSEYEKNVSDYIVSVAEKLGLPCDQDAMGNVIVRKPGSEGMEDAPPVMLQAHLDMVGVRGPKSSHDFTKDPLELLVDDDGNLHARDTTLGADDGYGVAYILAILTEDTPHPPIEAVFTVQEENGCYGAADLDCSKLSAQRMIGLDVLGDPENGICVGCYTSDRMIVERAFTSSGLPVSSHMLRLELRGIQPNETGQPVHPEEANAIKLMARLLSKLSEEGLPFRLISMKGGAAENYVPVSCEAALFCEEPENLSCILNQEFEAAKKELQDGRQALEFLISPLESPEKDVFPALTESDSSALCQFIYLLPGGAIEIAPKDRKLLATNNVGLIDLSEGRFSLVMSDQARNQVCKESIRRRVSLLSDLYGMELRIELRYASWEYREDSEMRRITKALMEETYQKEVIETVCPGGLEACDFLPKMPDLDIVMFAPLGGQCHTIDEWMNLDSFNRVYAFLKALLKRLTQ